MKYADKGTWLRNGMEQGLACLSFSSSLPLSVSCLSSPFLSNLAMGSLISRKVHTFLHQQSRLVCLHCPLRLHFYLHTILEECLESKLYQVNWYNLFAF